MSFERPEGEAGVFSRRRHRPLSPGKGHIPGSTDIHKEFGELSEEEIEQKNAFVSFAGRIVAFRDFGKSCFLHVQDREGSTQVYVRKDTLKSPD